MYIYITVGTLRLNTLTNRWLYFALNKSDNKEGICTNGNKVGINGFGRIGRNVFRAAMNRDDLEIVAVNDLTNACTLAHLLQYDSVHGTLEADIYANEEREFRVNGRDIKAFAIPDPGSIPWGDYGVEIVVEATGRFYRQGKRL